MSDVTVNGVAIPESDIAREMPHHPASSIAEARRLATEALVLRRILVDEADRVGIAAAEDNDVDDPRIGALIRQAVQPRTPDEETCRRYYERNRSKFRSPDRYDARHILLPCAPGDLEARDAAKEKASRIIAALQRDPSQFAALAIAYSSCRSRNNGGSLGLCERGDTVSEFETYVMSLADGELCPVPIETRYGVHVIALDRKLAGELVPFEAVHERIAEYLAEASFQTAVRHYMMHLAGRASIDGFEIASASTPLLQ
jgi:peptidyl-prolyl cis-trans isomerase C